MLEKLRGFGWLAVEFGTIVVALCVLLSVILGDQAGHPVADIAANAVALPQKLPAGITLGLAALIVLWRLLEARLRTGPR